MYIRFYPKDASVEARAEFFKHWHKMKSACTAPPQSILTALAGNGMMLLHCCSGTL